MTALSFGGVPGIAVLGGDLTQLRRRGGRWRLRDWRLRTKLTAVLLVPLLLAGVLGALRVADSLRAAADLDAMARQLGLTRQVDLAVHELQEERHLVAEAVATGNRAASAELQAQTQRVDSKISALRAVEFQADELGPAAADTYRGVLDQLSELPGLRQTAFAFGTRADDTITAYSKLIAALLDLNRTVLIDTGEPLARDARAVKGLIVAEEQISQQHAVLLIALLSGMLSDQQQSLLRSTEARFDAAIEEFLDAAPPEQQQRYDTEVGAVLADRKRLLNLGLARAPQTMSPTLSVTDWDTAVTASSDQIHQLESALFERLRTEASTRSDEASRAAVRDAAAVTALLLLAVLLLVLVVRALLGPLRTLRTAAFDVADRRLPEVVEKLRNPDQQIAETIVDPVPVFSREEFGQVARAFDTVHVQAVRLAAEQAMLRSTINDIFLNLAGRIQRLVERQLKLISKLEGAEHDPEQLNDLFQLDHLATRMRRNSENLLVLAGGERQRGTERGMTLSALLRAAVSEIAEFRRVTTRRLPTAIVAGPAAGDLVHLIAELLDNATNAGLPDTPVTLSSMLTEDGGLTVEITDSGPGIPAGELQAINERLVSPPVIDVSVSRHMGLFVVSRLAARHRIRVRLRRHRGELGITAVVQVPPSLVSTSVPETAEPAPGGPTTTEWRDTDMDLPLQVSVIDGPAEADQLGPSSIGSLGFPRSSRSRTAEQEWLELFGRDAPDQAPPGPPQPAHSSPLAESPAASSTVGSPSASVPVAETASTSAPGSVQPSPPLPPGPADSAVDKPPQMHEEIFEEVSAWFRERQSGPPPGAGHGGYAARTATPSYSSPSPSAPATPPAPPPAPAPQWRSMADAGWQAANTLYSPVDHGVTSAGLPRRRPQAHLVPGAAGPSGPEPLGTSPAPAGRTPDDVRGRLSSYQRGLQHGRHARLSPDEGPAGVNLPHQGSEETQQ